ncbi:hypothetical protein EDD22DRAFT_848889 [Suillus occidentalis]|nr:hypothetical protein EDD22DRAFT_848889 [Suillus occidentalis]
MFWALELSHTQFLIYFTSLESKTVIRAVESASASTAGGVSKAAVAIIVTAFVVLGLFTTYSWWRPAIPVRSFYTWIIWMPCFITITEEQEHSERDRHGEECRRGGANDAFVPPLDPAAIHRTECNRSWERYSECTVSCWPMETMSDMASVSIGAPSEPAAAHEATDDAPIPPAGEIEHHSEHNASFLEMPECASSQLSVDLTCSLLRRKDDSEKGCAADMMEFRLSWT